MLLNIITELFMRVNVTLRKNAVLFKTLLMLLQKKIAVRMCIMEPVSKPEMVAHNFYRILFLLLT
jgi:hypothetical protein